MYTSRRNKIFFILAFVSFAAFAALGYSTWSLSRELSSLRADSPADSGLSQKLEALASQQAQRSNPNSIFDPWSSMTTDPFARLQSMQDEMERLFQSGFPSTSIFGNATNPQLSGPNFSLEETEQEYRVVIDLAQNADVELNTTIEDKILTINAVLRQEQSSQKANMLSSSTSLSQFSRNFELRKPVDATRLETRKGPDKVIISVPKLS